MNGETGLGTTGRYDATEGSRGDGGGLGGATLAVEVCGAAAYTLAGGEDTGLLDVGQHWMLMSEI